MLFKGTHLTHEIVLNHSWLSCVEDPDGDERDGLSLLIYHHALFAFVNGWLVPECTVSKEELDRIWAEWRATGVVRVPFRRVGEKVEREGLSA